MRHIIHQSGGNGEYNTKKSSAAKFTAWHETAAKKTQNTAKKKQQRPHTTTKQINQKKAKG